MRIRTDAGPRRREEAMCAPAGLSTPEELLSYGDVPTWEESARVDPKKGAPAHVSRRVGPIAPRTPSSSRLASVGASRTDRVRRSPRERADMSRSALYIAVAPAPPQSCPLAPPRHRASVAPATALGFAGQCALFVGRLDLPHLT